MNCAKCAWSPITRKHIPDEELPEFRERAKAILGFTPTEKPCLLCLTPEDKISKDVSHWHANFRRGCQVRKCVTNMGIKNCAYCSRFPCAFKTADAGGWTRENLEKKLGQPITDEDYHTFVEPFESLKRLEQIRSTLEPDEIVEAITLPPLKLKVVEFPTVLSGQQAESFRSVHTLLSTIKQSMLGVEDADLPPQQFRLKNRVKVFLRFLWIFAAAGNLKETNGGYLVVDAKTFYDNRGSETGLTQWPYLEQVHYPTLAQYGVQPELVELTKEWKAPMGGLRKAGWEMKLSFTKKLGGLASLKAFQTFGKKLFKKYGKQAFRYFNEVDMRLLTE